MKGILLKILIILIVIFGCSFNGTKDSIIHIKGSDTMLLLTKNLSEEYMKTHPQISVYVDGGGTATGVKALVKGDIDICTASRPLKPEEVKMIADKYSSIGIHTLIAKDALSVYLNPKNPIKDLSIDQLKKIFTCQINNWSMLNGKYEKILPIIRPPNSGTHYYFKEHVLGGDEYCEETIIKSTTPEIISEVLKNENAIGYGGIGYKNGVVHAKINGIEPTEENVVNNKYPISRYLHFYTLNTPRGIVSDFINWVISPEGQKIVEKSGYISIWLNNK
jgi:phosphate transport system substrate-binding protein